MTIPDTLDEIYVPQTSKEILNWMLEDYKLYLQKEGVDDPAVYPGTEVYIRFLAIAESLMILLANLQVNAANANEQSATGDALDYIRKSLGLMDKVSSAGSGEVLPTIIGSSAITFPDQMQLVADNGLYGYVDGTQTIFDGYTINVAMILSDGVFGSDTNLKAGTKMQFANPPINCTSECEIYSDFTGGNDNETDADKRARILSYRRNPPGAGNWSHLKSIAEDADSEIQVAFVYPALGGPGSAKIVLVKQLSEVIDSTPTRQISASAIENVKSAVQTETPAGIDIVVQSVADETVDFAIRMQLSKTTSVGWLDRFPFTLNGSTDIVTITSVNGVNDINITTTGTFKTPPLAGHRILIYNPVTMEFEQKTILTIISVSGTEYHITFSTSISDITSDYVGYYISPAFSKKDSFLDVIIEKFNELGPGENTSDGYLLLNDRSYRKPSVETEWVLILELQF
jgi:uncharacterized phage protein gp47/JayE